jgi:uncharacterized protein YegL
MSRRPGAALATRPLHFIWICDASGSMSLDGKMESLNYAIREALPHMKEVAAENPNATVVIRTLRFSSGARWTNTDPVPLSGFRWTDMSADSVPQTRAFAAEFRRRLQREGAKSGDVQISLIWNNYNDLDLHVTCPHGDEIYFADRESECSGELDVDMNVLPTSTEPVENVYWPPGEAPEGAYEVHVHHYRNHEMKGCEDPTPYRVAVSVGGMVEEFTGRISHGEEQLVHTFHLDPQAIAGKGGGNTDMGAAMRLLSEQLSVPPMEERALPPVLVLISDGQPTDDFEAGLKELMKQPWAKKAVRIAVAIGQDADLDVLQKFIGHLEFKPLQANNPEALVRYIKWVSTAVLKSASSPASQSTGSSPGVNVPIPSAPETGPASPMDVW